MATTTDYPEDLQSAIANTKVTYTNLGTSGLRVSIPILGAMSFGHKAWAPWVLDDEVEVEKLLKGAYDRGVNTWDTANIYSNGVSEEMIGRVVKKLGLPREKLVIMTKCFGTVGEEPGTQIIRYNSEWRDTADYVNQGGLSRQAIFNAVEKSLKRLQMEYVDVLQIHRFDERTPVEETMRALDDLVRSGKVRYIGASSMWAFQFQKMQFVAEKNGWTKFVSMQNHYSLCYREEEREMNKLCAQTGVGLIPWSPLYRGFLARPLSASQSTERSKSSSPLTPADEAIIKRVEELAEKKGWKMAQVALAWIVQKGTVPIVGVSSLERLDEAVGVRGKTLTEEEVKYLEEEYKVKEISGHS